MQLLFLFMDPYSRQKLDLQLPLRIEPSQWRNRGGGGGVRQSAPPETSHREISADLLGKKRQGKNVKGGEEKKENCKREGGKIKNGREKLKNEERTFFFLAFHFSKQQKFVLGLPKWKFSTRKKHFTPKKKKKKKKQEKLLCPFRKNSCYAPEPSYHGSMLLHHCTLYGLGKYAVAFLNIYK